MIDFDDQPRDAREVARAFLDVLDLVDLADFDGPIGRHFRTRSRVHVENDGQWRALGDRVEIAHQIALGWGAAIRPLRREKLDRLGPEAGGEFGKLHDRRHGRVRDANGKGGSPVHELGGLADQFLALVKR